MLEKAQQQEHETGPPHGIINPKQRENRKWSWVIKHQTPPTNDILPPGRLHLLYNFLKQDYRQGTKCSNTWVYSGYYVALSKKIPLACMFIWLCLVLGGEKFKLWCWRHEGVFDKNRGGLVSGRFEHVPHTVSLPGANCFSTSAYFKNHPKRVSCSSCSRIVWSPLPKRLVPPGRTLWIVELISWRQLTWKSTFLPLWSQTSHSSLYALAVSSER